VSVMSSSVMPAAGLSLQRSTWISHGVLNRLAGFGLTLIALGPVLVVATGITLTALAVIDLVRQTAGGIETVAGIVESKVTPQMAKVESALDSLGAPLSQFKTSVEGAMTAFEHLGDIQVAKGAWGTSPSVHVKLPPSDVSIGEVTIEVPHVGLDGVRMEKKTESLGTIGNGSIFNESTPSIAIPPGPIVVPMGPLQRVLEPLGPNGPVGKAIKAAESGLEGAVADVGNLRKPILEIRDGIAGLLAPLEKALAPILSALLIILIAFLAQALLWGIGILYLIRTRPMEFANALIVGVFPFGLLGYCYRALLQLGVSLLSGRRRVPPERLIVDLRARAERLQFEIASLRAEFLPHHVAAQ
jgi:hypothetical protein